MRTMSDGLQHRVWPAHSDMFGVPDRPVAYPAVRYQRLHGIISAICELGRDGRGHAHTVRIPLASAPLDIQRKRYQKRWLVIRGSPGASPGSPAWDTSCVPASQEARIVMRNGEGTVRLSRARLTTAIAVPSSQSSFGSRSVITGWPPLPHGTRPRIAQFPPSVVYGAIAEVRWLSGNPDTSADAIGGEERA